VAVLLLVSVFVVAAVLGAGVAAAALVSALGAALGAVLDEVLEVEPVVAGAAGAAAAGAPIVVVLQFLFVALPPRLPPLMALPVAVQPAPGVELLGATSLDDEVPAGLCARAMPPNATAAAAATVAIMLFFITDLLCWNKRNRNRARAREMSDQAVPACGR
jgi:hypothetical protein